MLDFASLCERGGHQVNQDFIGISEDYHCAFLAVADGKTSPSASELVVNSMLEDFKISSDITTSSMPHFFDKAQRILTDAEADANTSSDDSPEVPAETSPLCCSTAVLLTDGDLAVWGHIGDCRIYHLKDHLLYEITADHSMAYASYEAGDIRYPQIRTAETRHSVTKMLGVQQDFRPEFSSPTVVKGNDCFLICTDGFWENIHELQVERTLRRAKNASDWLERMHGIVKKNARRHKYTNSLDSYSAITLMF